MSILPVRNLTSSFQLGLRAVLRTSEKISFTFATRRFSGSSQAHHLGPCIQYDICGISSPSRTLRHFRRHASLPTTSVRTFVRFRAITRYTELPDSYEDAAGLPFRREDLNTREANQIFGTHVLTRDANQLLKIMHGRRVAGTLEDSMLQRNTAQFYEGDKRKALEYLRKYIPVDEALNAGLRAEDELAALEEEQKEREKVEEEGLSEEAEQVYEETAPQSPPSKPSKNEEPGVPTGRLPKKPGTDSPYGVSSFDKIRADNVARQAEEERRLAEEARKREEEEASQNTGTLSTEQAKPRELSPWAQKHAERATDGLEAPPEMTFWQRVGPSLAVALSICLACGALAYTYEPRPQSERLFPNIPPAAATCLGLIGANVIVWGLWKYAPAWRLLNRYAILDPAVPRPAQLIGAQFSHQEVGHLVLNMIPLYFFGTRLHDEIGRGDFLAVYLSSGVLGFLASLTYLCLRPSGLYHHSLGASGCVFGVMFAYFWKHRFDEFRIFGLPPEPVQAPQGLGFMALLLSFHVPALLSKKVHRIDMASHFGGMTAGIAGVEAVRRIRAEKMRRRGGLMLQVSRAEAERKTASADLTKAVPSPKGR